MDAPTLTTRSGFPAKSLNMAAGFWFVVALAGLWLFVYYLAGFYGKTTLLGEFEAWGKVSLKGHIPGDFTGNMIFGLHILMAAVISLGGVLQLVPRLRAKYPAFHRWNGRIFIFCVIAISLGGFYLVWVREATTTTIGAIGITLNGLLMIAFALRALQLVRAGNIREHRKWAMRTFIVANGVWFFRVGLFAWIILNQGPVGIGENFDGPFVMTWSYLNYLLPLAMLELYFLARERAGNVGKSAMSVLLVLTTLLMAAGIAATFLFMWLPELSR